MTVLAITNKSEPIQSISASFSTYLLFLICICIFVPFSPKMPSSGLDSSWALGLNQAIVQGLSFGKEIIFTLGPYSSIYTKAYHPALDYLTISSCFYLAWCYWLVLMNLLKGKSGLWALSLSILLLTMVYSRDSLLFSYPLLLGLVCFKSTEQYCSQRLIGLLFTPLGLLVLVKSSLFALSFVILIISCLMFACRKQKTKALLSLIMPIFSLLFFWLLTGQSLANLPAYLTTTITMISSFTAAMSAAGDYKEIILYVINSIALLLVIAFAPRTYWSAKIFLLLLFFFFLFLSLKTGFTRHYGHALIPGTSILIAALFWSLIYHSRASFILILCSLGTWYYITGHYASISIYKNFISTLSANWHGFSHRITTPYWLKEDFALSMEFLKQQGDIPLLKGKTDIYSYNQTYLIASNNVWAPRPIFQSYSVFNAALAAKNTDYLQSEQRPDNIIFKIEPIDERIPALEDGASWPLLVNTYQPFMLKNDFLFLHKRESQIIFNNLLTPLLHKTCYLGKAIILPSSTDALFLKINIKPTLWGKLAVLLFKSSPLEIKLLLQNGSQRTFQFIPEMAKAGFLISPLIENTTEFTLLFGKINLLSSKAVRELVINTSSNTTWFWEKKYEVHLEQMHTPLL